MDVIKIHTHTENDKKCSINWTLSRVIEEEEEEKVESTSGINSSTHDKE